MTRHRARPDTRGPSNQRVAGLLHDRNFRLLWAGETTSALGTNITRVALPLVAVVTLDATAFEVSLLTALTWLPWLLIGLPAGAWVDRFPRRPIMLICDTASLVVLLSVPITAWLGGLTLVHLLAVALLLGAASVFFQTAYQVYLPGIVAQDHLPEANAKLQGSEATAQIAGPGIGGLIAQAFGAVAGLLGDAVTFLVSLLCLLGVRRAEQVDEQETETVESGLLSRIRTGLAFLMADPYLRVLAISGAVMNFALMGYQSILIVFLVRDVGLNSGMVGLLVAGMSVGGLLGAVISTTLGRKFGTARSMLATNLAAGPFALLIPLTEPGPGLSLLLAGGIGAGAAIVSGNVLKVSFRQTYVPRQILGRVVVSMQFLNYGAIPLGALSAGTLAALLGLRPTMWIMTASVAVGALILLVGPMKRHRDFPATPSAAAPVPEVRH